jgi:hypothetical protein
MTRSELFNKLYFFIPQMIVGDLTYYTAEYYDGIAAGKPEIIMTFDDYYLFNGLENNLSDTKKMIDSLLFTGIERNGSVLNAYQSGIYKLNFEAIISNSNITSTTVELYLEYGIKQFATLIPKGEVILGNFGSFGSKSTNFEIEVTDPAQYYFVLKTTLPNVLYNATFSSLILNLLGIDLVEDREYISTGNISKDQTLIGISPYSTDSINYPAFPVSLKKSLRSVKMKDIVKETLKLFGAIGQIKSDYIFNIDYYDKLIENVGNAYNWSNKIDIKSIEIEYLDSNHAKKMLFNWSYSDTTISGTKDSYINCSNQNLQDETEFLKMDFVASKDVAFGNKENKYASTPVIKIDTWKPDDYNTHLDAINKSESGNRFLVRQDGTNWASGFELRSIVTQENNVPIGALYESVTNQDYKIKRGQFSGLEMSTIIKENYKVTESIIRDFKRIKVNVKLTIEEIRNFTHFNPVFIDCPEHGIQNYFYVESIDNFLPNKMGSCKLVKIF